MGRLLGYTFTGVLALMLLAAPLAAAGGGCINRNPANDGALATIQIKDCAFAPTVTRVAVDSEVTWKNVDFLPHVISGVGWGSVEGYANTAGSMLNPGGSFSFTFTKPGLYPYACFLHPGMSGVVIVGDVDGSAVPAGVVSAKATAAPPPASPARVASANADGGGWTIFAVLGAIGLIAAGGFGLTRIRR